MLDITADFNMDDIEAYIEAEMNAGIKDLPSIAVLRSGIFLQALVNNY